MIPFFLSDCSAIVFFFFKCSRRHWKFKNWKLKLLKIVPVFSNMFSQEDWFHTKFQLFLPLLCSQQCRFQSYFSNTEITQTHPFKANINPVLAAPSEVAKKRNSSAWFLSQRWFWRISACYVFLCTNLLNFISVSQRFNSVPGIEKAFLSAAASLRWLSRRNTTFLCSKWTAVLGEMSPGRDNVGEKTF